uniref:DUF6010 family protein n=1 Tax=Candidatus Electronema sp. TaxID=2698783 RepID=UPI004056E788
MDSALNVIGLLAISMLYLSFGAAIAFGSAHVTKNYVSAKVEHIFYAIFLGVMASFYLPFIAYFGDLKTTGTELTAVAFFAVLGLIGLKEPAVMAAGYALHCVWDVAHEWNMHFAGHAWEIISVPVGYGSLCIAFDVYIAVYCLYRRKEWLAAWKGAGVPSP